MSMGNDSPFKRAEIDAGNRVAHVSSSGPCNPNVGCSASTSTVNIVSNPSSVSNSNNYNKPLDLSENPFINGNYVANQPQSHQYPQSQQQQQQVHVAPSPQVTQQNDYSHNPFLNGGNHQEKQSHVVSNSVNGNSNKGAAYAGINSVNSFVSGSHNGNNLGNGLFYTCYYYYY